MRTSIIYGPPGTGKTYTLQKQVESFGRPTLCVSFTRAAARELGSRGVGATASTLHSIAYRAMGVGSYAVVDKEKLAELTRITGIPFRGGQFDDFATAGDEYLSAIALARSTFREIGDVADELTLGTAGEFVWFADTYAKWREQNHYVDFTDMIMTAQDRGTDVDLSGDWAGLVIDEAQDLTPAQWSLVDRIIDQNKFSRVWAAGDDDQAIFGWAGASPQGMMDFGEKYGAEDQILTQSFRIPSLVHGVAEGLIQRIRERKTKEYAPRDEEGQVERVFNLHNAHEYDAILYRNHSIGVELCRDLVRAGVPYVGRNVRSPMASKQAKVVMAYGHLGDGVDLPGKITKDISKLVFGGDVGKHLAAKTHWTGAFPIPADLRQKLMTIEARFGPLHKVSPVTMSTIHQYKGKEENAILLVDGANERTATGAVADPDAEIRVSYVGVTRAKHKLGIMEMDNPIGITGGKNV